MRGIDRPSERVVGNLGGWDYRRRRLHSGDPIDRGNVRFELRAAARQIYDFHHRRLVFHAEVTYTTDFGHVGTAVATDVIE